MYQQDKEWEETYKQQIIRILRMLMHHLAEINVASLKMDKAYATDYELKLTGGTVAVRLRRPKCGHRDLTIRAQRDNGMRTELVKIREGHAFRYFYGWTDDDARIAEWILVDLDTVRSAGLLEKERPLIPNDDGTHFIAIPIRELYDAGCLLAYCLSGKQWESAA